MLECNYYCCFGEVDMICKEAGYLVFVEVKYRKDSRMGSPAEAIQPYKIHRIVQSAEYYLCHQGYTLDMPVRFDVVAISGNEIQVIKNAFEAG